jgi:hypothetical protein
MEEKTQNDLLAHMQARSGAQASGTVLVRPSDGKTQPVTLHLLGEVKSAGGSNPQRRAGNDDELDASL